jgi:hypothetical protein
MTASLEAKQADKQRQSKFGTAKANQSSKCSNKGTAAKSGGFASSRLWRRGQSF